ncbi:MAG: DUF1761 family protein [Patescibacteria group bacterium]
MMLTILILSVIGAVLCAVVGTVWYSNATPMGKLHMQYLGFDKLSEQEKKKKIQEAMPTMPKIYAAQIGLSFLTSFATVFIVTLSIQNNVPAVMAIGFVAFNWLAFMVPIIGQGILWSNCDPKLAWKKFFSDSLSNLVSVLIFAFLASFFA